jgi:hypothetical protein
MKSISASIVVLSGSVMISVGALVPHSDTRLFVMFVGSVVGLAGLYGWFVATSNLENK